MLPHTLPASPAILRIIDANSNRVREGLRVLEDYARFARDDAVLSATLKAFRHDYQTATKALQARAVAARDAAGDVGTTITTETETRRESLSAVVTAAGKRIGEALRTIEEYAKMLPEQGLRSTEGAVAPHQSAIPVPHPAVIEQLRYRFYAVEQAILLTLAPGRERMAGVRLHVLITASLCRRPWLDVAAAAIDGGAGVLQLREKDMGGGELLLQAKQLVALCRRRGAIAVINDRPDVALLSEADGVHVGQADLPISEVRRLAGTDLIVGVSTHAIEQARAAHAAGADYIGVGPIFPSTTKPQADLAGLDYAREAASLSLPTVGISGITAENAARARAAGLSAVAVSGAVCSAEDPAAAAAAIVAAMAEK
jgi:thiamine-phosphate pyrophosphorylase